MSPKPRFTCPRGAHSSRDQRKRSAQSRQLVLTCAAVLGFYAAIYGALMTDGRRAEAAQATRIKLEAVGARTLRAKLAGGAVVRPEFFGDESTRLLLEQNQAAPLALAAGDFDEDGMPDLVTGYAAAAGGVLGLNRGNAAAVYPRSRTGGATFEGASAASGSVANAANATEAAPAFLSPACVWPLADTPDFVVTGDFNADGHLDVVFAARGKAELHLMAGDGRGNLGAAQTLALPGALTTLAAGDVNRADGLADLVLGIETAGGAQLLIYESPDGAWRTRPEVFALKQRAEALAVGRIDRDAFSDVVVGAGSEMTVVRGRDRLLSLDEAHRSTVRPATVERVAMPSAIRSLAVGSFADGGRQVAALLDGGAVYLASEKIVSSDTKRFNRRAATEWRSELFVEGATDHMTELVCAKVSPGTHDDLVLTGAGSRRLEIISRRGTTGGASAVESASATFELDSPLVAALPMRLNADALSDFVVLRQGVAQPAVVESVPEAIFTVTSTADSGPGSLRDAITQANQTPGTDVILFSISSGAQTIAVQSPLPTITEAVTIDATSQPGFAGRPIIELSSAAATGFFGSGLVISSGGGGTTVRGLVINGFAGDGITISSSNNVIEGNFIGTDRTGVSAVSNGGDGINLTGFTTAAVNNNRIGGTVAAARNVISGNSSNGVRIVGTQTLLGLTAEAAAQSEVASGNSVLGNFIGVNVTGTQALANGFAGVAIVDATNNAIGGTTVGARNIIAANDNGIVISRSFGTESTAGNLIQGNYLGLNAAGAPLGNNAGVLITGQGITVGGTTPAARNVISSNITQGVRIDTSLATNNIIAGNFIGTDPGGTVAAANGAEGVVVGNSLSPSLTLNNTIGGATASAGNSIAFNALDGVAINSGSGNAVLSNAIFQNGGLGIRLAPGANNNQIAPVLTSAVITPTGVIVVGTLNSTPNTGFTIQFFANTDCDPSGAGEGQTFIGQTAGTTDTSGTLNFTATLTGPVALGQVITATATSAANNTSAFSRCLAVTEQADLNLVKTAIPAAPVPGSTVTYTITLTNNGPSNARVVTVTDTLPPQLTAINCTATGGGVCTGTGSTRTISFGSLSGAAPNNTATITISGTIPCQTTPQTLTNTATVSARTPDPVTSNNSASVTQSVPAGAAAVQTALDAGTPINLGPVIVGSISTPPSATFTVTSTGCLPVNLGTALFTRDIGTSVPPGAVGSLDDSKYFRLSIVNASGPDTPLTPDAAGNIAVNRTLLSGQALRFRVTFNPPFPDFAGKFAGRTGTLTVAQFLPDVVNSRLTIAFNGSDPSNPVTVPITGRVSTAVQIVTRPGFTIPQSAPGGAAAEAASLPATEAAPLVIFQRVRDEFRIAVSIYDANLNVTKITYQFFDTYGQIASDPIEVPISSSLLSSLLRGQSFTVVQPFTGALSRPDVTYVRVTVADADNTSATAQSNPNEAAAQSAAPALPERDSAGATLSLPAIRLERDAVRVRPDRSFDGARRTRKE